MIKRLPQEDLRNRVSECIRADFWCQGSAERNLKAARQFGSVRQDRCLEYFVCLACHYHGISARCAPKPVYIARDSPLLGGVPRIRGLHTAYGDRISARCRASLANPKRTPRFGMPKDVTKLILGMTTKKPQASESNSCSTPRPTKPG